MVFKRGIQPYCGLEKGKWLLFWICVMGKKYAFFLLFLYTVNLAAAVVV